MKFTIEPGTSADIDELEKLYDELNDYLAATTNYPGWIKGVYPVREDAVAGVNDETLYVARYDGRIVGSVILNHQPEKAYENVKWKIELGHALMDYSLELAQSSGIKSVRLDVYEKNLPAISLYEKCGFEYIDTVDLGLGHYGLEWFKLYEKIIL